MAIVFDEDQGRHSPGFFLYKDQGRHSPDHFYGGSGVGGIRHIF
jgi:hypothetical protein